jgi:hypothetical protein
MYIQKRELKYLDEGDCDWNGALKNELMGREECIVRTTAESRKSRKYTGLSDCHIRLLQQMVGARCGGS